MLNEPLRANDLIKFEVRVKKSTNAFVRIEYGDGKSSLFSLGSDSPSSSPSTDSYVTIKASNTYDTTLTSYKFKVTVANHLFKQENYQILEFQSNLPRFIMTATNATDISQLITFKLWPASNPFPGQPIEVPSIVITFDLSSPNAPGNTRQFPAFSFDKSNNFTLITTFKYSSYGLFQVMANCSNAISSVLAKTNARIGASLGSATGYIVNQFANIKEYIYVNLRVAGGTGYYIQIDYGDSNNMILPWTYLISNGNVPSGGNINNNLVAASARFTPNGVFPMYAYKKPGQYDISVSIVNSFSSLNVEFCTQVCVFFAFI